MSTGLKLCIMEVNKFPSADKMWSFGDPREERVSQPPAAGRVLETDLIKFPAWGRSLLCGQFISSPAILKD